MARDRMWNRLLRHPLQAAVCVAVVALATSACSIIKGGEQGNPLPTPRPTIEVGSQVVSAAKDTPEGTWDGYLRDQIAYQVAAIDARLTMLQRYENPKHTAQNTGGLFKDVSLLEDRTKWSTSGNSASSLVDYDIRVTFLDGDTETRHCKYEVQLQYDETDKVWYVISPGGLDIDALCTR